VSQNNLQIKFIQDVFCPWCYVEAYMLKNVDYEIVPVRFLRQEVNIPDKFLENFLSEECKIIEGKIPDFKCAPSYPKIPSGEKIAYTIEWVKVHEGNERAREVAMKMRDDLYRKGVKIWEDDYIKELVPNIKFDDTQIELRYRANEMLSDAISPGIPKLFLGNYVIIGYRDDIRELVDQFLKEGRVNGKLYIVI